VGGLVGAQDVGQHEGIAGVGLLTRHRVPISVAGHRQWVDRVHVPPRRAQTRNEQAAAGLDGDRDRLLVAVAGIGEQLQQRGEPGRVVADSAFGDQRAVGVDQGDVVMVFGPVDATEHSQDLDPPRELAFRAVQSSRQGHASALMAGLEARHPTSRS
jgi:hypothetical protein